MNGFLVNKMHIHFPGDARIFYLSDFTFRSVEHGLVVAKFVVGQAYLFEKLVHEARTVDIDSHIVSCFIIVALGLKQHK